MGICDDLNEIDRILEEANDGGPIARRDKMPEAKDYGQRRFAVLPRKGGALMQMPIFFYADAIATVNGVLQVWGHDPGSQAVGDRLLMAYGPGEWVAVSEDDGRDHPVCLEKHGPDPTIFGPGGGPIPTQ